MLRQSLQAWRQSSVRITLRPLGKRASSMLMAPVASPAGMDDVTTSAAPLAMVGSMTSHASSQMKKPSSIFTSIASLPVPRRLCALRAFVPLPQTMMLFFAPG